MHPSDKQSEIIRLVNSYLAQRNLSDSTRAQYKRLILQLHNDIKDMEYFDSGEFLSWISKPEWGNAMRWFAYCSVRAYLRWKYDSNHPALKLKFARKRPGPQRCLTIAKAEILFGIFDDSPLGVRNHAIAALLLDTGLRASEICNLELQHLDIDHRHLDVVVKGGEWGQAVFSRYTADCLRRWLSIRNNIVMLNVNTVFVGIGGNTPGQPLTRQGLLIIVRKWGEESGIGPLSPHDFRRGFATIATKLGAPERIAMKAGRWSDPIAFSRYVQALTAADIEPYLPLKVVMPTNIETGIENSIPQNSEQFSQGNDVDISFLRTRESRMRTVLGMFSCQNEITASEVVVALRLSPRQVRNLLNTWVNDGWLIACNHSRKFRSYKLNPK